MWSQELEGAVFVLGTCARTQISASPAAEVSSAKLERQRATGHNVLINQKLDCPLVQWQFPVFQFHGSVMPGIQDKAVRHSTP